MALHQSPYTFGIEEEYYLVDTRTHALVKDPPRRLIAALKSRLGPRFSEEFMRSQIEISTAVCTTAQEARAALLDLRHSVADAARPHGLAPIAAATHPFTRWRQQQHRDNRRYNEIADDFQALGRRMLICGLHVHIGVPDPDTRIALMNDLRPYLPVFLALSGSSPFWGGEVTGLKSYRTAINDATPRKGIPEPFTSWRHFEETTAALIDAGIIEDATRIWWDVRPSVRFPTLEVRIMDVCPLVDDAVALASLLRCLCRRLDRTRGVRPAPAVSSMLVHENRWRAQRYGLDRGLIDWVDGGLLSVADMVERLLAETRTDAEALGCVAEVAHTATIAARGTSADRQLGRFSSARAEGLPRPQALRAFVAQLMADTVGDGECACDTRAVPAPRPADEWVN
jgi:glutamate---cysteine ligase / carboxylate-amine ligase